MSGVYVGPEGPKDANVAVVGEGPGEVEEKQRRPFVGKSGKKLNQWLNTTGWPRDDVYLTNITKYRPRSGKKSLFGSKENPSDAYLDGIAEVCQELSDVDPDVVITLGNYAMWGLTEKWGIMSWRGSPLRSTVLEDQWVVPSIHPAWFMRTFQWQMEPLCIWDFKKARNIAEDERSGGFSLPDRDFITFPDQKDIQNAVDRLLEADVMTFDTEWWSPTELACIGFTDSRDWAICIPTDAVGAVDAFHTLLGSDVPKVAQNAMFDVVYLRRAGIDVNCYVEPEHANPLEDPRPHIESTLDDGRIIQDTMVSHHVCWPQIKNALDTQTSIYTYEQYYKDDLKVWQETRDKRTMFEYNCKDVCVTHEIWEKHSEPDGEMDSMSTERAYNLQMSTFGPMVESTIKGIRADIHTLKRLRHQNQQKRQELLDELEKTIGWRPNTMSTKDIKKLVYGQLGVRERKRKPTAQGTLMDIAAQEDDPTIKTILTVIIHIRKARNANSKYINESLIDDRDGRIRCSWNMAGTKNGRLSASKDKFNDTGASLQTIPYQARQIFIPDPGMVFVKPDLEQAEARIVAYLAEDFKTIDWIEQGLDIHCKLAEQMFDKPYEQIVAENKKSKGDTRERYLAKRSRHALNYKMGSGTFKRTINKEYYETGFGVTQSEARDLRDQYLTIHSALEPWWDDVISELSANSALTNPLGRKRRFVGKWGDALFRDAIAFQPQSCIGDMTHIGLRSIDRALPYAEPLINIHDGILLQVPEDKVDEALPVMKQCLEFPITVNGYEITIPTEFEVGDSWGTTETVEV